MNESIWPDFDLDAIDWTDRESQPKEDESPPEASPEPVETPQTEPPNEMRQLELRFYPNAEIASLLNLDPHGHSFADKVKRTLNNWGYGYTFLRRRGYAITYVPTTAEERLKEILCRVFEMDAQTDAYHFACFVVALLMIEGFDAMPWDKRAKVMCEDSAFTSANGRFRTGETSSATQEPPLNLRSRLYGTLTQMATRKSRSLPTRTAHNTKPTAMPAPRDWRNWSRRAFHPHADGV